MICFYADSSGLSDIILFHTRIEYNDLPCYYSVSEVTLFLSKLPETFGLSLLNSACCGTYIISYGSSALMETVPSGIVHVIVDEDDMDAMVKINECGGRENMEPDIRRAKEKYRFGHTVKEYVSLF